MSWADAAAVVALGVVVVLIVLGARGMSGKDQFRDDNDQGH